MNVVISEYRQPLSGRETGTAEHKHIWCILALDVCANTKVGLAGTPPLSPACELFLDQGRPTHSLISTTADEEYVSRFRYAEADGINLRQCSIR